MPIGAEVVPFEAHLPSLGSEVRQLRKTRKLTLKAPSEASGISLSHLSAIERGASNPSMEVLRTLCNALQVTPDWFFARRPGSGPMERAFVVRAQNRRNLNALYGQYEGELGYSDALLSSSIGGNLHMGIATYSPHSERPDVPLLEHTGKEHGIIIEGELEMQIGDELITLREGDSYSFDARTPHHGRNKTDRVCKLIWAVSTVVIPKDIVHREDATSTTTRKVKS